MEENTTTFGPFNIGMQYRSKFFCILNLKPQPAFKSIVAKSAELSIKINGKSISSDKLTIENSYIVSKKEKSLEIHKSALDNGITIELAIPTELSDKDFELCLETNIGSIVGISCLVIYANTTFRGVPLKEKYFMQCMAMDTKKRSFFPLELTILADGTKALEVSSIDILKELKDIKSLLLEISKKDK